MTSKSSNNKKVARKVETPKKESAKGKASKPKVEEEEDLEEEETEVQPVKAKGSSKKKADDDDGEDDVEVADDWEKPEEDDSWDPDFDEFDVPKSKVKKSGLKKTAKEEEDFKADDDFKEMPEEMKLYINYLNEFLSVPVRYISNGPGRDQIVSI